MRLSNGKRQADDRDRNAQHDRCLHRPVSARGARAAGGRPRRVLTLAPDAQGTISYQIPTFRLAGTYLLYFAGWKQYVSVYPVPSGPADYEAAVAPYRKAKGTLQFKHAEPLPLDVIAMVTRARLRELGLRPAARE
ncbi:iron chaperone [Devosia geojensis]|uniref:iron chaperone n=1 Tax=Devosia geojensis TaxID=443610 RepID=UPI000695E0EB|nr:DUF1801 domain-containing protein [Devosia geojensis]